MCSQLWTLCEVVPGDGNCLVVPVALLAALSSSSILPHSSECFVGINISLYMHSGSATCHGPITSGLLLLPTTRTCWYSRMGRGNVFHEYSNLLSWSDSTADNIIWYCLLEALLCGYCLSSTRMKFTFFLSVRIFFYWTRLGFSIYLILLKLITCHRYN
jgi:hypothetical protein